LLLLELLVQDILPIKVFFLLELLVFELLWLLQFLLLRTPLILGLLLLIEFLQEPLLDLLSMQMMMMWQLEILQESAEHRLLLQAFSLVFLPASQFLQADQLTMELA
jgi:hypothetical protein